VINPGAIPRFQGNADALEADASSLKGVGQGVRDTGADVHATWQGMAAFYEAPEAARLFVATEPVRARADDFGADVEAVAGALSTYAAEVRPIAQRLEQLRAEAQSFVASVEGDDDWREDGDKVDRHNDLLGQVDGQVLALQDAERSAANAINALSGGRQWHAGGADDPNAYGPTEIPANAERPWGAPEAKDEPWWKDVWNGGTSLVKGFFVDGLWEDVKGLFGFVNIFDWDTFSSSWGGLWSLTGKWLYAPGEALEAWKNLGKAVLAWDMWGEDPARALGTVLFNVVTLPFAALKALKAGRAGKAGKAGRAGAVDDVADAAGDAGKLPDPKLLDELADAGKADPHLPTVGDLARQVDSGTPEVRVGDLDEAATAADEAATAADDLARNREPIAVGAREAGDNAGPAAHGDAGGDRADLDAGGGDRGDLDAGGGDRGDAGGDLDAGRGADGDGGGWLGEDGGGEVLRLDPPENAAADAALDRARAAEPRITDSMMSIRDDIDGAELVGLQDRLKTEDSLKRKLATDLLELPDMTYAEVLDYVNDPARFSDSVRYTLQLPDGSYAAGVREAVAELRAQGFENVTFKNSWGSDGYQGINSTWRDPATGQTFEVQFHTAQSFTAKTVTHDLYDKIRLPGTPADEVARLIREQAEVFGSVPVPPGAVGLELP
jgi:hypothetical protein